MCTTSTIKIGGVPAYNAEISQEALVIRTYSRQYADLENISRRSHGPLQQRASQPPSSAFGLRTSLVMARRIKTKRFSHSRTPFPARRKSSNRLINTQILDSSHSSNTQPNHEAPIPLRPPRSRSICCRCPGWRWWRQRRSKRWLLGWKPNLSGSIQRLSKPGQAALLR